MGQAKRKRAATGRQLGGKAARPRTPAPSRADSLRELAKTRLAPPPMPPEMAAAFEYTARNVIRTMLEGDARALEAAAELGEDAIRRRPCVACGAPTLRRELEAPDHGTRARCARCASRASSSSSSAIVGGL